jgi:hypothetical protein
VSAQNRNVVTEYEKCRIDIAAIQMVSWRRSGVLGTGSLVLMCSGGGVLGTGSLVLMCSGGGVWGTGSLVLMCSGGGVWGTGS